MSRSSKTPPPPSPPWTRSGPGCSRKWRSLPRRRLSPPASALSRQKVNYHLRALEKHGLARVAEERKWGGLTERRLVATARSYIVGPTALGPVASDPARTRDRLSASYLIALAARIVREMSHFLRRSTETGKRLATFSLDTEVRFRSPEERARFSEELIAAVSGLVQRHHHDSVPGGRRHRLVCVAYPAPGDQTATKEAS